MALAADFLDATGIVASDNNLSNSGRSFIVGWVRAVNLPDVVEGTFSLFVFSGAVALAAYHKKRVGGLGGLVKRESSGNIGNESDGEKEINEINIIQLT